MARVLVVGAGLAGLSAAIDASANGHHVVVLERSKTVGGRGTSQNKEGFSLSYGPHLLHKKGPLWQLCRRLSKRKSPSTPMRLDKIEIIGHGMIRPKGEISRIIENKRALKSKDQSEPMVQAASFLSSWDSSNTSRLDALIKSKLHVSNEGWIGLVGRIAAALDEIGVLIECDVKVDSIHGYGVKLGNGKKVEADVVILACGLKTSMKLLKEMDEIRAKQIFSNRSRTTASIIEVGLDSKPLRGRHAIVDANNNSSIIDYVAIQSRLSAYGSHLSAITVGGLSSDVGETKFKSSQERLQHLENFLDSQAKGWRDHIITELRQETITIHENLGEELDAFAFSDKGIIMAGSWVKSDYILADAAVHSGRKAGKNIGKAQR
jgi:protoporphyrinogen oxidase